MSCSQGAPTFGGRLWAVVVDDPVIDEAVPNGRPSPSIRRVSFANYPRLIGVTSVTQREYHGGGGWENTELAAWALEYSFWRQY